MAEVLVPRPAATVMTIRDAPEGCEVLMLRRNLNSDFVGGAYVFPGGGVDAEDATSSAEHRVEGLSDAVASARLGLDAGGLAYYVACLRELFEEAGLLIARNAADALVRFDDDETTKRFAAHRRAINARERRFLDVVAEEGLRLDLSSLEYCSHWVTPVGPPRRYDTRFFVAVAPEAQTAAHDAGETVADVWVRPADALERHRRGELEMIFPTIRNLEAIASFTRADEVLAWARSLTSIPRIEPRIIERDGGLAILVPGDDGFDEAGAD
jgi:8-oxo-dGTP pyrophosphatase MutT (NUDIX family)